MILNPDNITFGLVTSIKSFSLYYKACAQWLQRSAEKCSNKMRILAAHHINFGTEVEINSDDFNHQ